MHVVKSENVLKCTRIDLLQAPFIQGILDWDFFAHEYAHLKSELSCDSFTYVGIVFHYNEMYFKWPNAKIKVFFSCSLNVYISVCYVSSCSTLKLT